MVRFLRGGGLLGVALLALIVVLAFLAPLPLTHPTFKDLRGAYHVHSTRSDGWGAPEKVAHAAHEAGLSFVVLTDHNVETLAPPVYLEGVLLVSAVELSTASGHLVALGMPRGLTREERRLDPIGTVERLGGFSILAHPVQNRWPWTDWKIAERVNGFELYSGDTLFRRALEHPVTGMIPALAAYLGCPVQGIASLMEGDSDATARMLSVSQTRLKVALCGLDAHGYPPYESIFGALSMHVPSASNSLPLDPVAAAALVLESFRSGAAYCVLDGAAAAPHFSVEGLPSNRVVPVHARLRPRFPGGEPGAWRWQVTGPAHVDPDGVTVVTDGPGPVQAEIWIRMPGLLLIPVWRPWIVPSPFEVRNP